MNADTGRLAFELARHFTDVTALDFTARMIRIPIQLQEQGYVRYTMKDEGELVFYKDIVLDEYGLSEFKDRIVFMQADAMNLRANFTGYDLIILPALLEELRDPSLFLTQIGDRLNDYGYLIIASDYDWDLQKTPRDKWLGGFKEGGEPVTSFDGIKKVLESDFNLIAEPREVTRFVKKSSRVTVIRQLQLTIWMKKDV